MGRLIYGLNVSLDGYIASSDGGLDWATVDDEMHSWFNERMREVSASIYGRGLYETMAGHWPTALAGARRVRDGDSRPGEASPPDRR